ncbi:MAG: hypothetical protein K0S70_2357 [Microbacterium sp.]|jgi:hypothetical protein|nr:hypothetical protein [Microbacterium sp.]
MKDRERTVHTTLGPAPAEVEEHIEDPAVDDE